jgi:hypothetical protein
MVLQFSRTWSSLNPEPAGITTDLLHLVHTAELASRGSARLSERQTAPNMVVGQQIQMRLDLIGQPGVLTPLRDEPSRRDPMRELTTAVHFL